MAKDNLLLAYNLTEEGQYLEGLTIIEPLFYKNLKELYYTIEPQCWYCKVKDCEPCPLE